MKNSSRAIFLTNKLSFEEKSYIKTTAIATCNLFTKCLLYTIFSMSTNNQEEKHHKLHLHLEVFLT